MGEVYRARDTRLGRDVALKVLPAALAQDADRRARFEREAKLLASLNHASIAHVYGFESATPGEGPAVHFLAMELVPGEDLTARIARGPVPVEEAIGMARQIAEGLEAAHEQGIVHRDLKPANIKLTPDGKVKILDFGLAKAWEGEPPAGSSDLSHSPTMTRGTEAGMILGTAAYMSPEQARGKPVDKRADIWAFGVVLYEMLTGKQLFAGETVSDVLAAVLTREPDWARLPAHTPPNVRHVLRRCLARDPRERLRDIGDARVELVVQPEPEARPGDVGRMRWATWLPWALTAVAMGGATWALARRAPHASGEAASGHFTIELPAESPLVTLDVPADSNGPLDVSPDGRHVVYVAARASGTQLFARALTDLTPRSLPGTEGARFPFFSPDGQWVGFFADGKLKKTPLAGGSPVTLAEAVNAKGGGWSADGDIVFAPGETTGLRAVRDTGGHSRPITTMDFVAGEDSHRWPQVLSGHRMALFTVVSWSRETSDVALVDLDTGARRTVQEDVAFARYVPASPGARAGHLVFVREGTLMAAPLDPSGVGPAGPASAVVEGVRSGQFDLADTGVLVYTPGPATPPDYSLVWVDRAGQAQPINDLRRGYEDLHLSPDGRRVALTVEEPVDGSPAHVWLADTGRGTLARFTFEGLSRDPVWAPDGQSIVFGSKRGPSAFGLYRQPLDGRTGAELIWASPIALWPDPQSFTPDGRVLFFNIKGRDSGEDVWTLDLESREASPWLRSAANEWAARASPDGRFIAYNSDESGRSEVYVQAFPGPGGKRLVSQGGGLNAIWARDGRQVFYRAEDRILAVDVETSPALTIGIPAALFSGRYRLTGRDYDVSPDGRRFVMMRNDDPRTTTRVNVLLDWWRSLGTRLSAEAANP